MASDFASEILAAMPPDIDMVPVRVASVTPFTVFLAGSKVAVPASRVAGQAVAVGNTGYAFWKPPVPPLVILTA